MDTCPPSFCSDRTCQILLLHLCCVCSALWPKLSNYYPFSGACVFLTTKSNIHFWGCCFFAKTMYPLSSPIPKIKLQIWMLRSCATSWMISGVRTNRARLQEYQQLCMMQCCILQQRLVLLPVSY